jgi:hypothetical protein
MAFVCGEKHRGKVFRKGGKRARKGGKDGWEKAEIRKVEIRTISVKF